MHTGEDIKRISSIDLWRHLQADDIIIFEQRNCIAFEIENQSSEVNRRAKTSVDVKTRRSGESRGESDDSDPLGNLSCCVEGGSETSQLPA